ncbi:MAG TPA: TetR family transcriptional regulator [Longimicrobium sp.]|nr:TetR family transcriptional regulator [Longimicrobium sp.]
MRRARSREAKNERYDAILDAALAMYERNPSFEAFTMAGLAGEVGLAKGTLYLYFRTKEAVFLGLLYDLFGAWFEDLDARLAQDADEWTPEQAAAELVDSMRGQETLLRLLSILPAIVEQNVELDVALHFKREVMAWAAATGPLLEQRLPFLAAGQGARFLVHLHALVIGVWQLAEPSPVIRQVMERPELAPARVQFGPDLRRLVMLHLKGLREEASTNLERG